jgi:hypothetical protein
MFLNRFLGFVVFISYFCQSFAQTLSTGPSQINIGSPSREVSFGSYGNRVGEFVGGYYPGAIMIPVNIWGATKMTGLFRVPKTITLIELLSYAQGPSNDAKLHKVRIKRTAEKVEKTFTVDVQELIENPSAHDIPIMANDIVYVEPRKPFLEPQVISAISVLGTIVTIVATGLLIRDRTR